MTNPRKIKICGMRDAENIQALAALNPDYMGFIFYPLSKRFVTAENSFKAIKDLPAEINKVGVFVNAETEEIIKIHQKLKLDFVQIHGQETPEMAKKLNTLGLTVWKAFGIDDDFNFKALEPFEQYVEAFVFDTKTPLHGGSGMTFDWQRLRDYQGGRPFLLSGGLGLQNSQDFIKFKHPNLMGYDLNSQLETAPGLKSIEICKQLINKIRNVE